MVGCVVWLLYIWTGKKEVLVMNHLLLFAPQELFYKYF